ncbi:hypothetical protein BRD17_05810 [Halobacteriales archaeon SW_7_68_16]|nr:MAG: hypothetical protein BRD17_05810 [Halobacteriales archaeon SW_7_68_16]
MTVVRLYEDGEAVGYVDAETSDAAYDGDDGAVAMLIDEIDDGISEVVPAAVDEDFEGSRPVTTVQKTGDELIEYATDVLENLGVECRITDDTPAEDDGGEGD